MRATLLLRWLILLFGSLACWQIAPEVAKADEVAEARVLFDAGVGASGAERWSEARDYLRRSLALSPKAATWFNLAVAEVKLGLRSEALATLNRFDHVADSSLHADMIERAQALRAVAERLPPDSAADAFATSEVTLPATTAAPEVTSSSPPAVTLPKAPVEGTRRHAPHAAPGLGTWLSAGSLMVGGAALAATGLVSRAWWLAREEAFDECTGRAPQCDNRDDIERQRRGALSTAIITGVAALGLLVGGTVWLVRLKHRSASPELVTSTHGLTVGLSGSF